MPDVKDSSNRILYGLLKSKVCLSKAMGTPDFINLFGGDYLAKEVAYKSLEWFKKYKTLPEFNAHILDSYNKTDPDKGMSVKMRLLELKGVELNENAFEADIDVLKVESAKKSFKQELGKVAESHIGDIENIDKLSSVLSNLNQTIAKIDSGLKRIETPPVSNTTKDCDENIEEFKKTDISKEKRFKIGHRVLDQESKGFKYGEVLMVLGYIGQGKSMFLVNMIYNLWRDGANILLLPTEMQPSEFDARIYSRASAVDSKKIVDGELGESDIAALNDCIKYMKSKSNEIKIKYLSASENIGTVAAYLEELKVKENFIPDVLVVDSFADISPLDEKRIDADWQAIGQIMKEFKNFATTFEDNRGLFVVSTHQAKTVTIDKKFEEIILSDFGRSKIIPEKADCCVYIRSKTDTGQMDVKQIKARRWKTDLEWNMGIDYSKSMVHDVEIDHTNSVSMLEYSSSDENL